MTPWGHWAGRKERGRSWDREGRGEQRGGLHTQVVGAAPADRQTDRLGGHRAMRLLTHASHTPQQPPAQARSATGYQAPDITCSLLNYR